MLTTSGCSVPAHPTGCQHTLSLFPLRSPGLLGGGSFTVSSCLQCTCDCQSLECSQWGLHSWNKSAPYVHKGWPVCVCETEREGEREYVCVVALSAPNPELVDAQMVTGRVTTRAEAQSSPLHPPPQPSLVSVSSP